MNQVVARGHRLPGRLDEAQPAVEAQGGVAVLPGEQSELGDLAGQPGLEGPEQVAAEALALPVGRDGQPADLGPRLPLIADPAGPDGRDEPALGVTHPERQHLGVGELGGDARQILPQRRKVEISVHLRLGDVGGPLQREDLTRVTLIQPDHTFHGADPATRLRARREFLGRRRRKSGAADDDPGVTDTGTTAADPRAELLAGYDHALPHVYGYLLNRCGSADLAEDLTAETFLAAASAVRGPSPPAPDVAWLIGVARHKLADHWRRRWRDERNVRAVASDPTVGPETEDPWDERLDALRARDTLAQLAPHHRAALTLRYVDDLPVPQVAAALDRTVHATEALLVRARRAFRTAYTAGEEADRD